VWFGFGVCCLSLLSTIALIVLDRRTNSQLKLNQVFPCARSFCAF
jgi:hypothetical protein